MENKFRNEMEITLGENKILLRPTFENIAAMEQNVGSVAWLGWKFSRGLKVDEKGKVLGTDPARAIRALPSLTESTKIIYYNQAATKEGDPTQKKYSIDEIWEMVQLVGAPIARQIVLYLARITAGNKEKTDEESDGEKKS